MNHGLLQVIASVMFSGVCVAGVADGNGLSKPSATDTSPTSTEQQAQAPAANNLDPASSRTNRTTNQSNGQSLSQAASDPTASLMSIQINDWYTASFHGLSGEDANLVVVRAVIPFKTGDLNHIFRATVPFVTDHPALDSGLSDITLFDLIVFNEEGWRWGVGPVALFPTGGDNRGSEKWSLGPAVGFTMQKNGFVWGVFNQNLLTVAGEDDRTDVNISIIQPILSVKLNDGWSAGASDMNITYDWKDSRWSSLPAGGKLSKLLQFGDMPTQFSVQYEHDYADDAIGPKDIIRFTIKFLFPA